MLKNGTGLGASERRHSNLSFPTHVISQSWEAPRTDSISWSTTSLFQTEDPSIAIHYNKEDLRNHFPGNRAMFTKAARSSRWCQAISWEVHAGLKYHWYVTNLPGLTNPSRSSWVGWVSDEPSSSSELNPTGISSVLSWVQWLIWQSGPIETAGKVTMFGNMSCLCHYIIYSS